MIIYRTYIYFCCSRYAGNVRKLTTGAKCDVIARSWSRDFRIIFATRYVNFADVERIVVSRDRFYVVLPS